MDQMTSRAELDEFLGVQAPSNRGRIIKYVAIAAGVLLLLYAIYRLFLAPAAPVGYATVPLRRGDLTVTVAATGNLAPTNQVAVGSELSGLVDAVYAEANDRVTRGQVLARLDTSRLQDAIVRSQAALSAAQAGVAQARATAQQARANLSRLEEVFRLSGGKVPSQTELENARAEAARGEAGIRSAQAAVAQAAAQLSSDKTNLYKATIRSPVNGVVLSREVEQGQTVAASLQAPTLFTIAEDLSQMKLEVKVDEADVGQVASGQRATFAVDAFPGRSFPATIQRVNVGSSISSQTSTSTSTASTANTVISYTAVLQVANPELMLRPGMTATADIVTAERRNVFLVPNAALRYTPRSGAGAPGGGGGLMTQMGPPMGRFRRGNQKETKIERGARKDIYVLAPGATTPKPVTVTVGSSNGSDTEVTGADLRPGMQVVTGSLSGRPNG